MPLSADLLAALRTPPQDPERFLVLADRLQLEGDVRGELIILQARRAEDPDSQQLQLAEERFLQDHARALLGKLWKSPSSCSLAWELGFIRHAMLWSLEADAPVLQGRAQQRQGPQPRRRTGKLLRLTGELLELESAALLESLTLGLPRSRTQQEQLLDAVVEVGRGAPPTLRLLQLRDLLDGNPEPDWPRPPDWHLPDFEPPYLKEVLFHGRPFTVTSDTLSLDAVTDALGAVEP